MSVRASLAWSALWIALALVFGGILHWQVGRTQALEFLAGWLIEKSLSIDNLFVFVVIFGAFGIPVALQRRVLFWGIISAFVLRAVMIFAGAALFDRFHWLEYVFGGFLVVTAVKLFAERAPTSNANDSWMMRAAKRLIPATDRLDGSKFLTVQRGKRVATPLLLALVVVELSDVVFAVDSIPAIFAVTHDPFIVLAANVFAMLGLRSLYFALAGAVGKLRFLKPALAFVLLFVGAKMLAADFVPVPPLVSVLVVACVLGAAAVASIASPGRARYDHAS